MLRVQKLKRPNKRSGHKLLPGQTTKQKGLLVTNQNSFAVYVDKFTRKPVRKNK